MTSSSRSLSCIQVDDLAAVVLSFVVYLTSIATNHNLNQLYGYKYKVITPQMSPGCPGNMIYVEIATYMVWQ